MTLNAVQHHIDIQLKETKIAMRHRYKRLRLSGSYLDVFPHAAGQYSHQYRYCGMSHFLASFCLFFITKLLLLNDWLQYKLPGYMSSSDGHCVRRAPSCDISCVCVLFALANGLSNGSLGFCVDEAWQNQALFLRVFITGFTHGVLPVA